MFAALVLCFQGPYRLHRIHRNKPLRLCIAEICVVCLCMYVYVCMYNFTFTKRIQFHATAHISLNLILLIMVDEQYQDKKRRMK
jgi:hypothetical protein